MKSKLINLLIVMLLTVACESKKKEPSTASTEDPVEKILNGLTLEEKAGQLNLIPIDGEPTEAHLQMIREGKVGSVLKSNGAAQNLKLQKIAVEESNAGIPILFQEDVIHGYKTIAPVPLAEAASWDMKAIRASAAVAAREAASAGIHLTYAPMVDICRDPRWGRIIEAAGEDPYLGSLVSAARVKGFQESGENDLQNILGCVKHFAGYGASLGGRDYNIVDFSERELREVHLPPFQAAIDAGVASLMCAYTAYDGVPLTANRYLLYEVLRKEMGFEGLIMTDWETIPNLVKIGVAENDTIASVMAMNTGIDIDMTSQKYVSLIPALVKKGLISEEQVDQAVRQVLKLKQKAGLLDNPYAYFNKERQEQELMSEQNFKDTKDITLKSMVLLKNESHTLPISSDIKKLAVIGPFAKSQKDLLGWWSCKGDPKDVISIYDGIEKEFGETLKLSYASGCKIDRFEKAGKELIAKAVKVARKADVVVMVLGEEFWMSGEGGGTASLHLPGLQEELLEAISKTGKPIVTIMVTGRPYILTQIAEHSDAILQAWMPGTVGGEAVADILSGKFNPCGKLPVTFPYHEGQIPIFHSYRKTSHSFDAGPNDSRYSTTYRDVQHDPLYPFGYGLSYTSFEYSEIELNQTEMIKTGSIKASVEVTNIGSVAGREIVQLYLQDKVCSVSRPVKELKGFVLLDLQPGETKTATFEIKSDKLEFIGRDYQKTIEPGEFDVFIGRHSNDTKKTLFTLK